MPTVTPDSTVLTPGDQLCFTVAWPPGTPVPGGLIVRIVTPMGGDLILPGIPNEVGASSARLCVDIPQDATRVEIGIQGSSAGPVVIQ